MFKRLISNVLCAVITLPLLTGCSKTPNEAANKPAEQTIVFRLAENQPEDYPTTLGDREFARLVNERTQGRIKIEVFSGGQLGNETSVAEQIQFGAVDFARLSVSSLAKVEDSMVTLMLPYLYRDRDHMFKVLEGPIGEKLLDNLEWDSGIVGLAWYDAGTRNFYNTKRSINTPDDMIGLKIRSQETALMVDLVAAVGAYPVAMAYGDVYSALQTGVIDGAENNWSSFEASKHYEVAKFFTVDEHIRVPELILASKMVMDKLSAEDKKIIKSAAIEAALFQREEWLKREEASKKRVMDSGVKITYLQNKDGFKAKVIGLYDKYGKEYKDIINDIINTK